MHLLSFWVILASLAARVLADVSISSPTSGQTFSPSGGSATIAVQWTDSVSDTSDDSSLSKVQSFVLVLCTGDNNNIVPVKTFSSGLTSSSRSYNVVLSPGDVPNGVYLVQVYADFGKDSDGDAQFTIHYTNRFTLTGMSGSAATYTFSPALFSTTGDVPVAQVSVGVQAPKSIDSRSFSVPYTMQTGKFRYAPMQTQPGPSISYTMFSNRHATSAYTPYSTIRPSPNVYSTLTPGWSYAVTSKHNTAAIAPYPTYFYPASSRVSAASLSTANKKRWL
ncbi:hypothetical protein JCM33374_g314 [Metschnikowia sp. JCM 33374]|nr:hypothetical protein JCM33374_g314 [Metschnikowia sp. JCM 33374]